MGETQLENKYGIKTDIVQFKMFKMQNHQAEAAIQENKTRIQEGVKCFTFPDVTVWPVGPQVRFLKLMGN